jgi:hypothetical protein
MNISEIWRVIWPEGQEDLFHEVIAGVFIVALTFEVISFFRYWWKCNNNQKAIKKLSDLLPKHKTYAKESKLMRKLRRVQNSISKLFKRNFPKFGNTNNNNIEDWIKNYLETDENSQPIQSKNKYLLTRYPEILSDSTRINLHFVCTLCTAIGVLGTFYGIQSGIGKIPLDNLNDSQALLDGATGLLEGMKTAFSTSLMGLGSSSVFTIILFVTDSYRQKLQQDIKQSLNKIIVTGKDSSQDAINSLKEIAQSFQQFDFSANLRASQALEKVAQNLNPKIIGQEVGNAVSSQLDYTIETKLTPVFNNIDNSQKQLTQITIQQKHTLENLISNMKNELITPVVERLDQSANLTKEASQAVTKLNNELGGITKELATSVTTIQQFQKETLGELKEFANSLKFTLTDFQKDTKEVLEQTAISINNAVAESIKGMEAQRQAFEESANTASSIFRGIKEDLEQSLQTQTESQKQMLVKVYSAISDILKQADESFKTQTQTLETVGNKASELMNNAKDNLEKTLLNIDDSLQKTRLTVQDELEKFRDQYQESLNQFFTQQNELLEGTLGKQRDALLEVVENLRQTFEDEIKQRNALMQDLTNTINQVKAGINEINQVSIELQERVKDIQKLTSAMGLNSAERLTQLQELARNVGTATQDFNNLLNNWQNHLNNYMNTSTQWQTNFFNEADSSMTKICSGLLETANVLVTIIEKERKLQS